MTSCWTGRARCSARARSPSIIDPKSRNEASLPGANRAVEAFQRVLVPTEHEQRDPTVGYGSRQQWTVVDDSIEIRQCPRRLIETKIAVAPLDQRLEVPRVLLENAVQRDDCFLVASGLVELKALISRRRGPVRQRRRCCEQGQQNRQADFKRNECQPHDPILAVGDSPDLLSLLSSFEPHVVADLRGQSSTVDDGMCRGFTLQGSLRG